MTADAVTRAAAPDTRRRGAWPPTYAIAEVFCKDILQTCSAYLGYADDHGHATWAEPAHQRRTDGPLPDAHQSGPAAHPELPPDRPGSELHERRQGSGRVHRDHELSPAQARRTAPHRGDPRAVGRPGTLVA